MDLLAAHAQLFADMRYFAKGSQETVVAVLVQEYS